MSMPGKGLIISGLVILFSCNQSDKANSLSEIKKPAEQESVGNLDLYEPGLPDTITTPPVAPRKQKNNETERDREPTVDWDKKIIKTAVINLEVKDFKLFNKDTREKLKLLGSYIAQEEQTQSDYKIENSLVIKVPVEQFDDAIQQLTNNAEKINEKKITSSDVTAEYFDTKSRLEAKKQVRLRYLDLLKQAKNMEEILHVQSEINSIQEEIESAAGRIEYLGHSSSYSTIHLTFYQVLNYSAKNDGHPSFGTQINYAFRSGWSWIGDVLIGIVSIWPLFLFIFAAVIIYKRVKIQKPKQA